MIIHIALQILFELVAELLAAFFDQLSIHEWEESIFFISLEPALSVLLDLFLSLHHLVRRQKVIS